MPGQEAITHGEWVAVIGTSPALEVAQKAVFVIAPEASVDKPGNTRIVAFCGDSEHPQYGQTAVLDGMLIAAAKEMYAALAASRALAEHINGCDHCIHIETCREAEEQGLEAARLHTLALAKAEGMTVTATSR